MRQAQQNSFDTSLDSATKFLPQEQDIAEHANQYKTKRSWRNCPFLGNLATLVQLAPLRLALKYSIDSLCYPVLLVSTRTIIKNDQARVPMQ